ncbi:MAG TPA: M4 family metallopeptidase [Polyangium sp.]|nr:M4 family metallopeptidase [Polyangium sp.]
MRISRVASILPMFAFLAGCATEEISGQKSDESIFSSSDQESVQLAAELALSEAQARPEMFAGVGEMSVLRVFIDEQGLAHARLGQSINGVNVFQGEAIVHLGKDGLFDNVTDNFVRDVDVDFTSPIDSKEALDIAINEFGGADLLLGEPKIDKQIVRQAGKDRLTYRVQLEMRTRADEPSMPVVFVDAKTREIVNSFDNLETVKNRKTYNLNGGTALPGTLVRSEGGAATGDSTLDQAHDNAGRVHDYYLSKHSRDSFDGAGAIITSSVHYSRNYVNAYWNSSQMVYGDGDGVQSGPLTVLDVVGHEITHAVTERSSNLVYSNESGALNEAMSDIFGAAIEAHRDGAVSGNTWKVGEECWTPGTAGDSLRQMDDPGLYGDYDYYPTRYTGTSDNGGVHWNSGIANLAFALAVKGGTHPRGKTTVNVTALSSTGTTSIDMGAKIFYRANTVYMTSGSDFLSAAGATSQAATDLYGATAANSIVQAWKAVGVPVFNWTVLGNKTGLSASKKNGKVNYTFTVPAGATAVKVTTTGTNGDADLYVRKAAAPTTTTYDCRSAGAASNESCVVSGVTAGTTIYVMINAYSAFSGLSSQYSGGTAL